MDFAHNLDFFLGSVGSNGFEGFFSTLSDCEKLPLYLLKSGPGCGKSTILQKISSAADEPVEKIHCSSDPKSLDGVILHDKAAVLDATSPHSLDPVHPALTEHVISLYDSIDPNILHLFKREILSASAYCAACHKLAASHIKAAAYLLNENTNHAHSFFDIEKVNLFVRRMAHRYLSKPSVYPGSEHKRLLSAFTPEGYTFFTNTILNCASHIIVFHDDTGGCSPIILNVLRDAALENHYDFFSCYCSLNHQKLEHLLIPELDLAFLTSNKWHDFSFPGQKNIHCKRFLKDQSPNSWQKRIRFNEKMAKSLFHEAVDAQIQAKSEHDKLEYFYRSAVDFEQVNRITAQVLRRLSL